MRLDCASFRGRGVAWLKMLAGAVCWRAGDVAAPVDVVLALRFENVVGVRLRDGGRGGRDLSLSNLLPGTESDR
jgi:hypothetical protein